jgi:hypothetical protein
MTDATIVGNAGHIRQQIERLSLPYQGDVLFNPLKLDIRENGVYCAVQSPRKTSFLKAKVDLGKVDGDDDVVLDSQDLLTFLGNYDRDEQVRITVGDTVTIDGERRSSTIYPQNLEPRVPASLPQFEDGIVQYRVGEDEYAPAQAVAEIASEHLAELVDDANTIDVASFPLRFGPRESTASLGSLKPKHNQIDVLLDADVEGERAETVIGEDFIHLFSNIRGEVEVQLRDSAPLVVVHEPADSDRIVYVLAPRKDA